MATDRRREPWSFNKVIIWTSKLIKDLAASPSITSGSGAPSASEPKGSTYLRTGGAGANQVLYVATDSVGTWEALQGDNDFGSAGIETDIVTESTTGAGVTIPDGVELNIGTGKDLYWLSDGTNVDAVAAGDYDITAGSYSVTDGTATVSLDGSGAISIDDGTGSIDLDGAGALSLTDVTTIDLDGSGAVSINSSGGAIRVGGDNVAQDVGIGTSGARGILIGSAAAASVGIDAGVGTLSLTADAYAEIDAGSYLALEETAQRLRGFRRLSDRYELCWVAGEDGLVATNASAAFTVSRHFELQGTSASDDDCTYYAEGGLSIETDGSDGDEVILWPHQDAAITPWDDITWGTDQEVSWECEISTAPLIATQIIWAGLKLTNSDVKATDADQVYFRYEDDVAAGNLELVYANTADGLVSVDTGVTLAGDTKYHLKLVFQADRTVKCYVNGALVATTNALDDATDLKPVIGTAADGAAAAVSIVVHGQSISRSIGA
jgi:hypothetical protein